MSELDLFYPETATSTYNGTWPIYNRPFSAYQKDAEYLGEPRFDTAVERLKTLHRPVILDLCSPPHTLRDFYITHGRPHLKAANVSDRPDPMWYVNKFIGITSIQTNLAKPDYLNKLATWLGDDLIDFTTILPYSAYGYVNNTWDFYFEIMQWILTHTNPDQGVVFLETPPPGVFSKRNMPLDRWLRYLGGNGVYVNYLPRQFEDELAHGWMFLQRIPGKKLPCE